MPIRIAYLGDIVGRPGRLAVAQQIPIIREKYHPDLIITNAENAARGSGLTPDLYKRLTKAGVDAITLGDHVYKKDHIVPILEKERNIIRPINLSAHAKGRGMMQLDVDVHGKGSIPVYVITVLGRIFMAMPGNDPFAAVDQAIEQINNRNAIVIIEVHAEATSEKVALGWYLNGRASAVLGTHTHIPTADARILPFGDWQSLPGTNDAPKRTGTTAYITDLGMCGPYQSVLGRRVDRVVKHMSTNMPSPYDVAVEDPRVCGVILDFDEQTGNATAIERIELNADTTQPPFTPE